MMSPLYRIACVMPLVLALLGVAPATAWAANGKVAGKQPAQPAAEQFVDGIVAVVDRQVITLAQLDAKARQVQQQMHMQGIPVPPPEALRRQVLQQMINAVLLDQEAKRAGLRVTEAQIDQAVQSVAQRNRITPERLRQEVQATGMSWDNYRRELSNQIQDDMLRQRFVQEHIFISDRDVDAFLQTHGDMPLRLPQAEPEPEPEPSPAPPPKPSGPELFEVAQILVEVPDYASQETVDEKRKQIEALLKKVRGGADFAGVAAASSDGPQALDGGNMGVRPLKDWPDLFAKTIANIPPGGVSGVIQSGRGFHILKVLQRGWAEPPAPPKQARKAPPPKPTPPPVAAPGPVMVTQTHARHILLKTSQVVTDDMARQTLEGLRTRIEHGESFEELARRYSEDASAPQGGDLGWLNPGEAAPGFEQAMDALKEGEVSEPVRSPFGWHLIQVVKRQSKDMEGEYRRMQARDELLQRRIGPAYEDWIDQLRSQAYIDNRLEKRRHPED
ncbi:peptidylprolyl isomerase [Castellaniella sp.]|uniref:peptidylprolyl isomerase n=1 Tax=Castellaniella sp. TaxID=1955812 RepID=UPI003562701D